MEVFGIAAVAVLIALLMKPKGEKPKPGSDEWKTYIEKEIDDLAGDEVVTQWEKTDKDIQGFCDTFKGAGSMASDATGDGHLIDEIVNVILKIINAGSKHYLYVHKNDLRLFGNVLALGTGSKPVEAGVCYKFTLPRGVQGSVNNDFREAGRQAGLVFKVVNAAGSTLSSGLSAGNYFAFAKITTPAGDTLIPAFVAKALSQGNKSGDFWRQRSAIVGPAAIVITKESIMARVDP